MSNINNHPPREPPKTKATSWSKQPLSTICYNTEEFLKSTLQFLHSADIIATYLYIKHHGEGGKDHYHLLLIPKHSVDLTTLRDTFIEHQTEGEPLGAMPFHTTHEENVKDWVEYVLHDNDYLMRKGMKRQFHYTVADIHTNDDEYLKRILSEINQRISDIEILLTYIKQGYKWYQVANILRITSNRLKEFRVTYNDLCGEFNGFEEWYEEMLDGSADLELWKRKQKEEQYFEQKEIQNLQYKLEKAEQIINELLGIKSQKQTNLLGD